MTPQEQQFAYRKECTLRRNKNKVESFDKMYLQWKPIDLDVFEFPRFGLASVNRAKRFIREYASPARLSYTI